MSKENSQNNFIKKIPITLFGKTCVGKTALIYRFIKLEYEDFVETNENYYTPNIKINNKEYRLDILDTGGVKEKFKEFSEGWIKYGNCFILVYSINDKNSFEEINAIYEKICQTKNKKSISIILVGNKCDLKDEREVTEEEGKKYAKSKGMLFLETSAKDNYNVNEVFETVANDYLKKSGGFCNCF